MPFYAQIANNYVYLVENNVFTFNILYDIEMTRLKCGKYLRINSATTSNYFLPFKHDFRSNSHLNP